MIVKEALRQDSVALHTVVPLETPFTFNITTNNYCNFKCVYCYQSLDPKIVEKSYGKKEALPLEIFQKAVDGMADFRQKFKVFNFCGTGETILTPGLADMVAYANKKGVVERTNVVTNAYALTHDLSDALIDAGLGSLRVSIQGLTAKRYEQICQVRADMDKFLEQLAYFYERRGSCQVHMKIIDIALDGHSEKEFYDMFGKYCDYIAVEHFVPSQLISYDTVHVKDREKTVHGLKKNQVDVCFSSFYALTMNMNGDVYPCCSNPQACLLGNVQEMPIYKMWHSKELHEFWKLQLTSRYRHPVCKACVRPCNALQEGDNLDPYKKVLLERLEQCYGS